MWLKMTVLNSILTQQSQKRLSISKFGISKCCKGFHAKNHKFTRSGLFWRISLLSVSSMCGCLVALLSMLRCSRMCSHPSSVKKKKKRFSRLSLWGSLPAPTTFFFPLPLCPFFPPTEWLRSHESSLLCEFSDVMAPANISARCDCRHQTGS